MVAVRVVFATPSCCAYECSHPKGDTNSKCPLAMTKLKSSVTLLLAAKCHVYILYIHICVHVYAVH